MGGDKEHEVIELIGDSDSSFSLNSFEVSTRKDCSRKRPVVPSPSPSRPKEQHYGGYDDLWDDDSEIEFEG